MAQGSQLGGKSTIDPERKHHPMLAEFFARGPGPLTRIGPLGDQLKAWLLELDTDAGTALSAYEPGEQFLQGAGVIQGGIVTAMLDYAMALACFTRIAPGKSFGTVSMTTNFIKPAMPGRYLAKARLDRAGARMMFVSSELRREGSDSLVATASSVLAITDI
jgi:uncharacterized protein (TIGR00369 family)